jgi:hypothetical protein
MGAGGGGPEASVGLVGSDRFRKIDQSLARGDQARRRQLQFRSSGELTGQWWAEHFSRSSRMPRSPEPETSYTRSPPPGFPTRFS